MDYLTVSIVLHKFSEELFLFSSKNNSFFSSSIQTMAEARNEVMYILSFVLNKDKVFLLTHGEYVLSSDEESQFIRLFQRRKAGEPLAYLTGIREFYGYEFEVGDATLIPRPDTEILVNTAVEYVSQFSDNDIYIGDLGTGTGCILLSILKEVKRAYGYGADISTEALVYAQKNAHNLSLSERSSFFQADFTSSDFSNKFLSDAAVRKFHVIVSNPPYIPQNEYQLLDDSVKKYEPAGALVSEASSKGRQGLFHIEKLLFCAEQLLLSGGLLLVEHGYNQGEEVRRLCSGYSFTSIKTLYDYGQNERALFAVRK